MEDLPTDKAYARMQNEIIYLRQELEFIKKIIKSDTETCLRQSMSRRGNCWDNVSQESFYGHMKDEIDLSRCTGFDQVRSIINDWMDYYNNDRY